MTRQLLSPTEILLYTTVREASGCLANHLGIPEPGSCQQTDTNRVGPLTYLLSSSMR